jgi:hypothetical protein
MQALENILVFYFVLTDKDVKHRHRGCHYKKVNAGAC